MTRPGFEPGPPRWEFCHINRSQDRDSKPSSTEYRAHILNIIPFRCDSGGGDTKTSKNKKKKKKKIIWNRISDEKSLLKFHGYYGISGVPVEQRHCL
jgi:hypothetical protein